MTIPVQSELLEATGTPREGSTASKMEIISMLRERFPGRGYCLVSDWTIFRADLTPEELKTIQARGHQPLFVYAHNVLEDSQRRFRAGDWVRTSMCVSFDGEAVFETKNTVYVLVGNGVEKTVSLRAIFSFF